MPIFVNALYELGASGERLKAAIAGGTFVDPAFEIDFEFDIGGRTLALVGNYLDDEGIQVEVSETGGFFSCSLLLNMKKWTAGIEPAGYNEFSESDLIEIPSLKDIRQAIVDNKKYGGR